MSYVQKPSDPARDFCQWPYERPKSPNENAWRQEKILFDYLNTHARSPSIETTLLKIQSIQGRFNTVWGLKSDGESSGLELYFYDYDRKDRKLGCKSILDKSGLRQDETLLIDDTLDYFMWSLELDLLQTRKIRDIDIYSAGTGGTVSAGICYRVSPLGMELKNLYYFFESKADIFAIREQIEASPRFKSWQLFPEILLPQSMHEEIYVVSTKRLLDSIYFSRVKLGKCISLMRELGFLSDLIEYLERYQSNFDHHLFDIGIDYVTDRSGEIIPKKMAIYGIF